MYTIVVRTSVLTCCHLCLSIAVVDYRMKMDEMSQANSDLTKHTLFLEKEGNIIKVR